MIIKPIWQKDPQWKNTRIGRSATTIGRDGCTLSSISMGMQKLRGVFIDPRNAATYWKYNLRGEILWRDTYFKGAKFIERGYYRKYDKIAEYANDPNRFAIIEVNHNHWLFVQEVRGKAFKVIDPIDGQNYSGLPSKYSVTGYALFEADQIPIPEWLKPLWDQATKLGLKEKDPAVKYDMKSFLGALYDMKLIDKPKDEATIADLIAAIDKIADRWDS